MHKIFPRSNVFQPLSRNVAKTFAKRYAHGMFGLVVWLSGNALVVINEVTLRQARLIQGWVTVCGQVNHLGM